jgi:hypothetical protein
MDHPVVQKMLKKMGVILHGGEEVVANATKITKECAERLRSRFADYEKMDDHPTIATPFLYADDATLVDDHQLPPFED